METFNLQLHVFCYNLLYLELLPVDLYYWVREVVKLFWSFFFFFGEFMLKGCWWRDDEGYRV